MYIIMITIIVITIITTVITISIIDRSRMSNEITEPASGNPCQRSFIGSHLSGRISICVTITIVTVMNNAQISLRVSLLCIYIYIHNIRVYIYIYIYKEGGMQWIHKGTWSRIRVCWCT